MEKAHREYVVTTMAAMAAYTGCIIGLELGEEALAAAPRPAVIVAALLPGLAIAVQIGATLRLISRADEFVRALTVKRFIAATAIAFMAATFWGFLELYAEAPHVSAWLVYPVFWGAYGLVTPFIRSTRP
jgi:hypothetical protein